MARADQGRLPIRPERLRAYEVLDRVRARFAPRAVSLGRALELDAQEDPELVADPLRLEQAVGNLVDNALKHGAGPVTLGARTRNGRVELYVADEGAGMPPDFISRAFDRFARPDDGRTSGGMGLGLSIVELIAVAHGGDAHVVNRPAGGTEIWLSLPEAGATTRQAAVLS
jgi:signal transduction histidine kinase